MRLVKYLAHAGVASRRGAEELIAEGRVTIDGKVVTDPARDVDETRDVTFDGDPVKKESLIIYAANKPIGVISTAHDPQGRKTVVELAPRDRRLYPVGRLDAASQGLILLTNDGELANRLIHPRYEVPKTYRVRVGGARIASGELRRLGEGIMLDDGVTSPAEVRRHGSNEFDIVLMEGRNRQVRRMCEAINRKVLGLQRIKFGSLELGELKPGKVRRLTGSELESLRKMVKL